MYHKINSAISSLCFEFTSSELLPAVKYDKQRQCKIWFNSIIAAYTGWEDAQNDPIKAVTFGDGKPLPADIIMIVFKSLKKNLLRFLGRKGIFCCWIIWLSFILEDHSSHLLACYTLVSLVSCVTSVEKYP
ncbi:Clavaminate synthase-like protein [Quillaja saponaria]|uniref:Clavaminate synthase-like protein n=1 Tax=Quillaja saponaria TaxID=32244 RepID=A0AAD7PED1_QUISA|nr:Clavaminate synthase-like protein [Quillaja saponaria]